MKIKRFFAKDMRTALAEVKETLGPDAVIMSNKKVSGGIEIVAAVDYQNQAAVSAPELRREVSEDSVNLSSRVRGGEGFSFNSTPTSQKNDTPDSIADSLGALLARQQGKSIFAADNEAPRTLAEQSQFNPSRDGSAIRPSSSARNSASPSAAGRDRELETMRAEMSSI